MRRISLFMALAFAGCCGLAFAQTPSEGTKKKGFVGDISDLTEQNSDYRRVLYTGKNMQLVLMSLRPGEEIGEETHDNIDQFFRIEEGSGEVVINGQTSNVKSDYAIIVPAGARHNVKNTGTEPLRLYTIYAPPEHKDKTIHATKQDAKSKEAHFDGKTSESSD
ncbi:MAG: cupin domain-containing protein [Rhodoplanes sp.]